VKLLREEQRIVTQAIMEHQANVIEPIMEFAYIIVVCMGLQKFSPFEVVYGFNPCVPIDLVSIPIDERTSMDGIRKTELMKELHEQVRLHIEEKTTK